MDTDADECLTVATVFCEIFVRNQAVTFRRPAGLLCVFHSAEWQMSLPTFISIFVYLKFGGIPIPPLLLSSPAEQYIFIP